ncbi:MAG: peptidoglycan-binding protein [Scytolyngbya sp. HA4215-MV1]|nr:peptidoglycan-binding protein [Scytolyngbya sp. HA4215-MV1]
MSTLHEQTIPASTTTDAVAPILYEGDSGTVVAELQKLLNVKGSQLAVDGFFGPSTKVAVQKFQQQRGLAPDGMVGSLTWAELRKNVAPPIRLVDVCRYYNPIDFPHQTEALEWLQGQISNTILKEFARRWRKQNS